MFTELYRFDMKEPVRNYRSNIEKSFKNLSDLRTWRIHCSLILCCQHRPFIFLVFFCVWWSLILCFPSACTSTLISSVSCRPGHVLGSSYLPRNGLPFHNQNKFLVSCVPLPRERPTPPPTFLAARALDVPPTFFPLTAFTWPDYFSQLTGNGFLRPCTYQTHAGIVRVLLILSPELGDWVCKHRWANARAGDGRR